MNPLIENAALWAIGQLFGHRVKEAVAGAGADVIHEIGAVLNDVLALVDLEQKPEGTVSLPPFKADIAGRKFQITVTVNKAQGSVYTVNIQYQPL